MQISKIKNKIEKFSQNHDSVMNHKSFIGYSDANLYQIFENDSNKPAYVVFG